MRRAFGLMSQPSLIRVTPATCFDVIESLGLLSVGQIPAMLADGTMVLLPMYEGMVRWNNEDRTIVIDAADSHALIGMSLLKGFQLTIQAISGGVVVIEPLQDSHRE